jgi:hypothetical protein
MKLVQAAPLVSSVDHGSSGFPARIDPARVPEQHWQFDASSGVPTFRHLSAQEAQDEIARLEASHTSAAPLDWLNDLGDLLNEAIAGTVQNLSCLVTTVVDGIQATFTFIRGAVSYIYKATITIVEEVFGLVEAVFTEIGVAFEALFQWLGELFNWEKIVRTHEAVKYIIQEVGLPFLQGALTGLGSQVEAGFASLAAQIQSGFDAAATVLGGQTASFLDEQHYGLTGGYQAAVSNNIILDAFAENLDRIQVAAAPNRPRAADKPPRAADDPITLLGNELTTLATPFQATNQPGLLAFASQLPNADGALTAPLAGLFGALQNPAGSALGQMQQPAPLDPNQTVVEWIIGQIQQAIQTVNDDLLNTPLDQIPLLDEIYATYVDPKDRLTALSVMALAIAIPAGAVYFTAFERHPFETDEDLENFKNAFKAEWLLQECGLLSTGTATRIEVSAEDREFTSYFLGSVLAASYVALSLTHRVLDAASKTPVKQEGLVRFIALVAGWIRWIAAVPWGLNPQNNVPARYSSDPQEFGNMAWMHNMLTPMMSSVMALGTEKTPGDLVAVINSITGLIQHVFACVYAGMDAPNRKLAHAEAILSLFPITFKFLKITQLVTASKTISLWALIGLDAFCWPIAAGLRIGQMLPQADAHRV